MRASDRRNRVKKIAAVIIRKSEPVSYAQPNESVVDRPHRLYGIKLNIWPLCVKYLRVFDVIVTPQFETFPHFCRPGLGDTLQIVAPRSASEIDHVDQREVPTR